MARRDAARASAPVVPTAPTVVHVTIGRVEVRAIQSASPPVINRSTPAVTTLDTYLRMRAGGGG